MIKISSFCSQRRLQNLGYKKWEEVLFITKICATRSCTSALDCTQCTQAHSTTSEIPWHNWVIDGLGLRGCLGVVRSIVAPCTRSWMLSIANVVDRSTFTLDHTSRDLKFLCSFPSSNCILLLTTCCTLKH